MRDDKMRKVLIVVDMQNDFVTGALGTSEAQAKADVRLIETKAEAEAKLIEAEATAEANRKVSQSLTDEILDKMYYETWNGVLPSVMGSDSTVIRDITPPVSE